MCDKMPKICDTFAAPHDAGFLNMQFVITLSAEQVKDLHREFNWSKQDQRLNLSEICTAIIKKELSRLERKRSGIDKVMIDIEEVQS